MGRMISQITESRGAVFSDDRKYRYLLWRNWYWGFSNVEPWLLFVGLNPSIADEAASDPTISQIIGRAKRLGFRGLLVVNVFGLVSTDPKGLKCVSNPAGPDNLMWIERAAKMATQVWCGWGNAGGVKAEEVERLLRSVHPALHCLGMTGEGSPRHPRGISLREIPREYVKVGV